MDSADAGAKELGRQPVLATRGAVVGNAEVHAQAQGVRLVHECPKILRSAEVPRRSEVAHRLRTHVGIVLALLHAREKHCGIAVACDARQRRRRLFVAWCLALTPSHPGVQLVDSFAALASGRCGRSRSRRLGQWPNHRIEQPRLLCVYEARAPRGHSVIWITLDRLHEQLVLGALDNLRTQVRVDPARPNRWRCLGGLQRCSVAVPRIEVAHEAGGPCARNPLLVRPDVASAWLQAISFVAPREVIYAAANAPRQLVELLDSRLEFVHWLGNLPLQLFLGLPGNEPIEFLDGDEVQPRRATRHLIRLPQLRLCLCGCRRLDLRRGRLWSRGDRVTPLRHRALGRGVL
mmetsp:Transcript_82069/g.228750  ORF Transcript_82069/g.228750 Transcript_82069/m.228750 type:complete len:348 (+) Transcript_82069:1488-2531(+)